MRTETPNETDPRIAYDPDHSVDVALDVALELADDPDVVEYIRRAQQSRVRVRELGNRNPPRENDAAREPRDGRVDSR